MKNKLHILKSELHEDGQQLRPKDVGGLRNKSFVQQVGVKFYTCLTEVYVIKDNINAFNKILNKSSIAVPPCWTRIMRFCRNVPFLHKTAEWGTHMFMALISVSKAHSSPQESEFSATPHRTPVMSDTLWEDREVRFDIPL